MVQQGVLAQRSRSMIIVNKRVQVIMWWFRSVVIPVVIAKLEPEPILTILYLTTMTCPAVLPICGSMREAGTGTDAQPQSYDAAVDARPSVREAGTGTDARLRNDASVDVRPSVREVGSTAAPAVRDAANQALTWLAPYMNSAKVDHAGVAIGKAQVAYDTVNTLHGSLKLPSERDEINYIPSVDALHFLSHSQGTRLLPYPPRYFP
jgi:hypothetical protein